MHIEIDDLPRPVIRALLSEHLQSMYELSPDAFTPEQRVHDNALAGPIKQPHSTGGRAMSLRFENPSSIHAPVGLYSHTVVVPEGTEMVFISGQLGVRPDGSTPSTIAEQADQVFANIVALVRSHGLVPSDIIKLTTFMVAGQDGDAVRAARLKYLGSHRPASTAVFVSGLVDPAWLVEVDAIAARR